MFKRLEKMPQKPLHIASCLILDGQNRLLLLRRHADDLGGGMWAAPGGKREPDEEAGATAMRETEEETGIKLTSVKYLGTHEVQMPHGIAHIKTFLARVPSEENIILNTDEHQSYAWFDVPRLVATDDVIWGLPTTLSDFELTEPLTIDPTLSDGSTIILLEKAA